MMSLVLLLQLTVLKENLYFAFANVFVAVYVALEQANFQCEPPETQESLL